MEEKCKLPVSAILGKELQAAREKIHELTELLDNQLDCDTGVVTNMLTKIIDAQVEVEGYKEDVIRLESEIAQLKARICDLEKQVRLGNSRED